MWWTALASLGLSAMKAKQDQERYNEDKKVQSTTARWSPWTNMQHGVPKAPNPMDTMMQGFMAGMMMSQQNQGKSMWGSNQQQPQQNVAPMQQPQQRY